MEAPTQPPLQNFLKSLERMATDTSSADFTIECHNEEHKVHKHVLALHSAYFERLFKSDYKEKATNRITLIDDPKIAVKCMIQFFYKLDYTFTCDDYGINDEIYNPELHALDTLAVRDPFQHPLDGLLYSSLQGNAEIYTLADKYDIPDLKVLAKRNFEALAKELVGGESREAHTLREFLLVVPYVYSTTPPNEKGLRTSVVAAWRLAPDLLSEALGEKNLSDLIERFPELGVDLVKGLVSEEEAKSRRPRGRHDWITCGPYDLGDICAGPSTGHRQGSVQHFTTFSAPRPQTRSSLTRSFRPSRMMDPTPFDHRVPPNPQSIPAYNHSVPSRSTSGRPTNTASQPTFDSNAAQSGRDTRNSLYPSLTDGSARP